MLNLVNVVMQVAEDPAPSLDFSAIITALTTAITPAQLLTYLASIVGGSIGLYVVWAITRKAVSWFKRAIAGH